MIEYRFTFGPRPMRRLLISILLCSACARASTPPSAASSIADSPALRSGRHEVSLQGVRIVYDVGGPANAPTVIFLHGGPGQGSAHFEALAGPTMERTLRMVYLDQRGSGASERPASNDYAIATLVEDIEALRVVLGVPSVVLLGHSFGGLLALEYAAKYPDRVSHVIFAAGLWDAPLQCRYRKERLAALRPEAFARVQGDTLDRNGTRRSDCELEFLALQGEDRERFNTAMMFPDPSVATRMDSVNKVRDVRNTGEMSRAIFEGGLLSYRFTAFDRLTMPVLVVAGAHDGAAGPQGQRELVRRLPNARYLELENSGHFMYLDETDRFAREVTAFVRARQLGSEQNYIVPSHSRRKSLPGRTSQLVSRGLDESEVQRRRQGCRPQCRGTHSLARDLSRALGRWTPERSVQGHSND